MHQLTAPHTPKQNGVAERMNRTIIEKARCMMFDSELSLRAWAEACQIASYIRNRTPIASLGFKCPQEIWSGQKVNVSLMKRFGTRPKGATNEMVGKIRKDVFCWIRYEV